MLRTAEPSHLEGIARLHELCFGDGPEAMELFRALRYRPEDCFLWEEDGRPLAIAHAFPMSLALGDGLRAPAVYVYAVATHPRARGRGLSTRLMEYLWDEVSRRGARAALLVPAGEGLFDFYRQRGYREVCQVREGGEALLSRPEARQGPLPHLVEISPRRYLELREEQLGRVPHAVWDLRQAVYQEALGKGSDGGLYAFRQGSREMGCCAVEVYGGAAHVKELLLPGGLAAPGAAALSARWPGQKVELRMPALQGRDWPFPEEVCPRRPFAMARADSPELLEEIRGSYFGLALD